MLVLPEPGIVGSAKSRRNEPSAALVELALQRGEGMLADNGAFVAYTGAYTGRAAKDKFIVRTSANRDKIDWGEVNQPLEPEVFDRLYERVTNHLTDRELCIVDAFACADPGQRVPLRLYAHKAWHALFAQCLFIRSTPEEQKSFRPALTIFAAPELKLDPERDCVRSEAAIVLNLERGIVLIAGTAYAGEIKKSVFTYLNYWLPERGVFPMHCSATLGDNGETALLFGLSGTGKTTLSADPTRRLIGDDEHGWSDTGVFNFEGGCYAKTIRLSQTGEPQIWRAIRFGAVLENVVLDENRRPNYDESAITENTRAAYPLAHIDEATPDSRGGHPRHLFFLACDAFGVLPPLSRLTSEQAMYHFLSGYTAKVAGTEKGVQGSKATFSSCFGAPFLPLHPMRYARLLEERLKRQGSKVWLVNTGWSGGSSGQAQRIPLAITRSLIRAVLAGELDNVPCDTEPFFGLAVPRTCPNVPPAILQPRSNWPDPSAYDRQAKALAEMFRKNFEKFAGQASAEVRDAGPK